MRNIYASAAALAALLLSSSGCAVLDAVTQAPGENAPTTTLARSGPTLTPAAASPQRADQRGDRQATARPVSLVPCASYGGLGAGCYSASNRHTTTTDSALDAASVVDSRRAANFPAD